MGKHSAKKNGPFGAGSGSGKTPRPAKRRVPSRAAGKRPVTVDEVKRSQAGDDYALTDPSSRRAGTLEKAPERLKVERDRRHSRAKRIALIAGASLLAVVLLAATGLFAYAKYLENTMRRTVYKQEKLDVDLATAKPQDPYNILILGVDKRSGETAYRSDTIVLARVDPSTKEAWLVSIPRDTRVKIPGHGYGKINSAYALGEEQLAIDTVEEFTGLPINHFMAIDFSGFEKVVDAMGGVWVDVPVEIDDKEADRSKGNKASHIDAGYQLLDGAHALTFVRTRHQFADQDFSRMKNQQEFAKAVAEQIATKTSIAKLPKIVSSVASNISTDMSLMEMLRTAQALKGSGSDKVYATTVPGTWQSPYIWPDEAAKKKIIAKMKKGESFEKKKSKEETSTAESETTASTKDASDITVTIRNGAGIAGCASQAASILKARAFKVEDVGNANQFVYDDTLVIYKDDDEKLAEQVAAVLQPGTKLVSSRGMYSFDTDVLVVVGKDWDLADIPVTSINTN